MSEIKGLITSIQRYSTKDGPGIRTTVFLINCNLRCKWCSNPESMYPGKKVMYHVVKCQRCGACARRVADGSIVVTPDGCKIDREKCTKLFELPDVCNYDAYEIKGSEMTPTELVQKLLRDETFYKTSNGGVTFSGGECLLQHEFVLETSRLLKEHDIHIALDTAGLWDFEMVRPALKIADLILYDIKAFDPRIHEACTGVSNEAILENARRLAKMDKAMFLRMIIVPGMNDEENDLKRRLEFAVSLGSAVKQVDLLKYHRLGLGKYRDLGLEYPIPEVPEAVDSDVAWASDYGRSLGLNMTVGG
jgi:pyruvate formate lyase activating enzyme